MKKELDEDDYGDMVFDPEKYANLPGIGVYAKRDMAMCTDGQSGVYHGPKLPNVGGKRDRQRLFGVAQAIMDYEGFSVPEAMSRAGII